MREQTLDGMWLTGGGEVVSECRLRETKLFPTLGDSEWRLRATRLFPAAGDLDEQVRRNRYARTYFGVARRDVDIKKGSVHLSTLMIGIARWEQGSMVAWTKEERARGQKRLIRIAAQAVSWRTSIPTPEDPPLLNYRFRKEHPPEYYRFEQGIEGLTGELHRLAVAPDPLETWSALWCIEQICADEWVKLELRNSLRRIKEGDNT